jgi:diacylglycerol O-acyltransferase
MNKLSLLDVAFFIAESEASPKHVGGLMICKRPPRSKPGFAADLYREFLTFTDVQAPFNRLIHFSLTAMPTWRDCESVDLAAARLLSQAAAWQERPAGTVPAGSGPASADARSLAAAVGMHVIDGLSEGRFAIYVKTHHASADGVTMMRWAVDSLSPRADDLELKPLWSIPHALGHRSEKRLKEKWRSRCWRTWRAPASVCWGLGVSAMLLLESVKLTKNAISLPFVADGNTPLTGQVTAGRQFATASVSMDRVNLIRTRTRSTLNHVALTCLDGALHRYLRDEGVDLQRPITIQMPVNLRKEGDQGAGNKIGIIQVELSPPTDDPYVRLRNIGFSLRNVRTMIDSVAPEAIESYTLITGVVGNSRKC